jgi:predicted unusual protein kinase regulating ubiquinone biosynthesis (AarF/ABC1/UbiB family)
VLYDEIDYINEGRNADRFRRNFRDTPWVRTPVVHWEFSSPRVLTLEYLPGVKITDMQRLQAAGVPTELVARRATEAYLMQVRRVTGSGFKVHAKLHQYSCTCRATEAYLMQVRIVKGVTV